MTPAHAGQPEVKYATPLEDDEDCLDAYYDDEPLWYRTVANILGERSPPDQPERLFAQLHLTGIDYDDAFAPVVRMESVRVLLVLAAQEGWQVHHMDVKSAFLNGDLEEEVYVR